MDKFELQQKFEKVMTDEVTLQKICNAESKEEMQKVFNENGVNFTMEDVDTFIAFMNSVDGDALTEEQLDLVSGGKGVDAVWVLETSWKCIKAVAKHAWNAGKWWANNVG